MVDASNVVAVHNGLSRYYKEGYLTVLPTTKKIEEDYDFWFSIYQKLIGVGKYVYIIEGGIYYHINDIITAFGISKPTIHYRINSSRFPEWIKYNPKESGKIRNCSNCNAIIPSSHRMLCMKCYKTDDNSFYEDGYPLHLPND